MLTLTAWCRIRLKKLPVSSHALRRMEAVAVIESASILYRSAVVHMEPISAQHKFSVFKSMVIYEMFVLPYNINHHLPPVLVAFLVL